MPDCSVPAPVTIGIDLAAQPARTVACRVTWFRSRLHAEFLPDSSDSGLLDVMRSGYNVGLDCPLGWPSDFVALVSAHHRGARLPAAVIGTGLNTLTHRRADDVVWNGGHGGRPPLSVSTDRLGVVALRAARLLDELATGPGPVDRSGITGAVAEVYPAAAARFWKLTDGTSYKKKEATEARAGMVEQLEGQLDFRLADDVRRRCTESHDHLDALLCAMVARAVELRKTTPPQTHDEVRLAAIEGWIHIPNCPAQELLPIESAVVGSISSAETPS